MSHYIKKDPPRNTKLLQMDNRVEPFLTLMSTTHDLKGRTPAAIVCEPWCTKIVLLKHELWLL